MGKTIVNLVNKICENNNNSKFHINRSQKSLLMGIVDTPEKNVANIDRKLDKRKVGTSSIKSSSTFFSFSIRAMYIRLHYTQNQRLMLKSYIPAINKLNTKKHYEIYFLKNYQ